MGLNLLQQLHSILDQKVLMILFDFLLLINFDFTISHDDFIREALKRSNLLTERRLGKSSVRRFIKAFVCEGFDVWSYKLLSGPVA